MKILFIARTYPPLVGGMERFAEDFYNHTKQHAEINLFPNRRGKSGLPLFFFKVLFYLIIYSRKYDIIHFNDAILSPLFIIIRIFSKAKITVTVHGLDIIYNKFGYQIWNPFFLRKADRIFPVSQYTLEQCVCRKIPREKLQVIHNGISFSNKTVCSSEEINKFLEKNNLSVEGKKVLLTIGRLIRRKGHEWFIRNVMPNLSKDYLYIIAGDGPEYVAISKAINETCLTPDVKLLGYVNDDAKACLFSIADHFIMPNIHIENDQEGFGIVLIEAGTCSIPVIASNIEGISDAVIDGITGKLVEEGNIQGFIDAIDNNVFDKEKIRQTIKENFDWDVIAKNYMSEFKRILN